MSCEAKLWQDDNDDWHAVHDGECSLADGHHGSAYEFQDIIREVEACMRPHPVTRWLLHVYPDGKAGLRGYTY